MIHTIIFDDEITLYWDKRWELSDDVLYRLFLNGELVAETKNTHYSFCNLQEKTNYFVQVEQTHKTSETVVLFNQNIRTSAKKKRIDVTKAPYFVKGDGTTFNTEAVQRALNDCKENEIVYFPQGVYLTGALHLHSDTELYLETGAILQGSKAVADYLPKRLSRFEGIEQLCYSPLLNVGEMDNAKGCTSKNVVIRGGGVITGGGKELAQAVIDTETENLKEYFAQNADANKDCDFDFTIPARARPRLLQINNCDGVILSNVTFQYGPAWTVHMIYSKNIVTYGCNIFTDGIWNGDGWNPDSSENCTIFDCTFRTGDDAIAIKSGKNPEGNVINRPTKNVRVFNCRGEHGIAIGSELSGGVENVQIWDCHMHDNNVIAGVTIKTTRKRGGYVKGLRVKDCSFEKIKITTGYNCNDDGETSNALTLFEDFYFENIDVRGGTYVEPYDNSLWRFNPVILWGFDEPEYYLKNVVIKNLRVHARKDEDVQHIEVKNVQNLTIENIEYIDD